MELYPSAKPLPKPTRVELKERKRPGMVRASDYEKRLLQTSTFKKQR